MSSACPAVTVFPPLKEAANALRIMVQHEPPTIMVSRETAAALCSMSPATYSKYAARGLLPPMNATGRVSIEAVRKACLRLDGIEEKDTGSADPAERALREWERA
jgi:hypothetical protein